MENMLLNFLIITLVLCYVVATAVLILCSHIAKWISYLVLIIHFGLLAAALSLFTGHNHPVYVSLLFSAFIFTGILLFALIIRQNISLPLKIYSSVFILSLPLFIFSPSRLITFMTLGHLNAAHAGELHITDNYYLVKEHGMIQQNNNDVSYKIIKRMGLFNKTLARSVQINFRPDSIKVLFLDNKSEMRLRVYHNTAETIDSTDVSVNFVSNNESLSKIIKK